MKCKYCDETLGDEDSHGCIALERKETPADKSLHENGTNKSDTFTEKARTDKSPRIVAEHLGQDGWHIRYVDENGVSTYPAEQTLEFVHAHAYLAVKQELEKLEQQVRAEKYTCESSLLVRDSLLKENDKLQQELEASNKRCVEMEADLKEYSVSTKMVLENEQLKARIKNLESFGDYRLQEKQEELYAARDDIQFLKLEINSYKIAAKGRQESEENLKRWLTETEKQAVDAFAQIKDYESALERLKLANENLGIDQSIQLRRRELWDPVYETLNKWRAK